MIQTGDPVRMILYDHVKNVNENGERSVKGMR